MRQKYIYLLICKTEWPDSKQILYDFKIRSWIQIACIQIAFILSENPFLMILVHFKTLYISAVAVVIFFNCCDYKTFSPTTASDLSALGPKGIVENLTSAHLLGKTLGCWSNVDTELPLQSFSQLLYTLSLSDGIIFCLKKSGWERESNIPSSWNNHITWYFDPKFCNH